MTAIQIQLSTTQHHASAAFHNLPPRAPHLVSEVLLVCSDDNILLFFCQCQRQVVIRAAHPENLPRLYPLSRANERSTAEDYLRKKRLYVPQPFPDGFMVFCLSTCSGDSHPAFRIQFCGDSHPAFHIQLLPYSGDSHPAALSNQHPTAVMQA